MTREDHDQRWKEAVKSKFSEAIDLLVPDWLPWFDFARLEWIEQEGARKYGKTSYELGQLDLVRDLLASRFGPLSEEASKRLDACSKAQVLELAKKFVTATSLSELGLEP